MFFPVLLILLLSTTIYGHGHSHRSRGHSRHSRHGHHHGSHGHSVKSSHGHHHGSHGHFGHHHGSHGHLGHHHGSHGHLGHVHVHSGVHTGSHWHHGHHRHVHVHVHSGVHTGSHWRHGHHRHGHIHGHVNNRGPIVPSTKIIFTPPTLPENFIKESKGKKINIQFLIDTSSVSSLDFEAVKRFVFGVASTFEIGPNAVEIGVTLYSNKVHNQFYLTDYTTKADLLNAISGIRYTGGKRFTGRCLRWVRKRAFKKARRGAPNLAILITGGPSKDTLEAQKEASRLQKQNINLIAIGIDGGRAVVREELEKIAGGSNNIFVVNKFDLLQSIFVQVLITTVRVTSVSVTIQSPGPVLSTAEPASNEPETPSTSPPSPTPVVDPFTPEEVTEPDVDEVTAPAVDEVTAPAVDEVTAPAVDEVTAPAVDEVTAPAVDCGPNPVDIHFLLDASGSILQHNFDIMLNFVKEFAKAFEIGPDKTQIGVTTFSDNADHQIWMNQYTDKESLLAAIGQIPYSKGSTKTHLALDAVRKDAFSQANGNRDGVLDILIVITDGKSHKEALTQEAAKKIHQENIVVLAIGVGTGFDADELQRIASDSSNVFTVSTFDALNDIQRRLQKKTCEGIPSDQ